MEPWHFPSGKLSDHEDRVMALVAEGRKLEDIAALWKCRFSTVRTYYNRALRKLGARSQGLAVARWKDHEHEREKLGLCRTNLFSPPPDESAPSSP